MSSRTSLAMLGGYAPLILPSILMCDFARLEDEVQRLEEAGAEALHLDVMDGHFVPNLSYGLPLVESIRRVTRLPLDVHLMIANPHEHDYLRRYRNAGADGLTIHAEVAADPRPLLDQIRQLGALAGLAISPPTGVASIRNFLSTCDVVLVMSVMPGFGGQTFDPGALDKLRQLRQLASAETRLAIDGGVNGATIGQCAAAGAQWFVVGSAIFHHNNYQASIGQLTELARQPWSNTAPRC